MTSWTRAGQSRLCGRCGATIGRGDPLFVIAIAAGVYKLEKPKVRCATCAGPAPPDLPPLVDRFPVPLPQAWTKFSMKSVAPMFDVKAAQVGDEE